MQQDFKDASQDRDNTIVAFYSREAEKEYGSLVASIPDVATGGRREIIYTATGYTPSTMEKYGWKDKVVVYQGPKNGLIFVKPGKAGASKISHMTGITY